MTAQTDPYVRVYYRIIDDPKFATVFDDDRRLATWLRLLLTADGTYPAPPPLPHGISRVALQHLADVHLIDLLPGHRYRMHGLFAERERRSEQARNAANKRHHGNDEPPEPTPIRRPSPDAPGGAPAMREQSGSNAAAEG